MNNSIAAERRPPGRPPKPIPMNVAPPVSTPAPPVTPQLEPVMFGDTEPAELSASMMSPNQLAKLRAKRTPFGSQGQKLAYPPRAGYHRHWFNDTPGRLMDAQAAAYDFVLDHEGKKVCKPVGVAETGGPLMAYLMEIPQELFEEDMRAQQERIEEMESAIKRGKGNQLEGDRDYVPQRADGSPSIVIKRR